MTGLVKFYDRRRGFGLITPLVGRPEDTPAVFFHISAVQGGVVIPRGAEVRFRVVRGEKGPQAADVELIEVKLRPKANG